MNAVMRLSEPRARIIGCAVVLVAAAGLTIHAQTTKKVTLPQGDEARISRIERGLLPAAIIKGQPLPAMTLTERMKHYHVPGVSMAYFAGGRIRWAKGYGLADVAANQGVTPDTLFQAASVSKPVTAVGALRLVQAGKLNLDEDVNTKFVSWKVPENEFTKKERVTLRCLLSHTAGMTVGGFGGYAEGEPLPTMVQILNGEKPANNEPVRVDRIPGTEFRYSGGGYVAVQLLMADVSGKPFPELLDELVFAPLGMTNSTFAQPLTKSLQAEAARPYDVEGKALSGGWRVDPEMAPAGLWTTPSDLARFAIEVQKAYAGEPNKLLSPQLARQMLSYQSAQVYGLGFALGARSKPAKFWHNGANAGYKAQFAGFSDTGEGVAIMTNGDSGLRLVGEIQRGMAEEYGWPDDRPEVHTLAQVDPKKSSRLTGTWMFGGQFKFTITQRGGKLYLQYPAMGEEPQELLAESETRFFVMSDPYVLDFQVEAGGAVRKATVRNGAERYEGEKIAEAVK